MRPFTVLIGIVLGSSASITFGLAAVLVIFTILSPRHPELSLEFHRLISGKPEGGAVFSVSNMGKPGSFDMTQIESLRTPGVSFFMTLPGPMSALDAWEAMLPTAQRLAELLDGRVLDEERNALGRQRIAHLRDELRAWDRKQERNQIRPR